MRALVLHGPDDLRLEDIPVPEPAPGEVVLRVEAAATCATDAKILRAGAHPALGQLPSPFGHEAAGTVAAVGEGVGAVAVGQRVIPANSAPCDRCRSCAAGQGGQCADLVYLWGAYAEYLRVPARITARNLVPIPDGLDISLAPLAEPLACAVRAVDRCRLRPGLEVLVIGGGAQGAMLCGLLAEKDCSVTLADPHRARRDRAEEFGARHTTPRLDGAGDLDRLPARPDLVIEAVGRPETWQAAVELVGSGGEVVFYGGCAPGSEVELPTHRLHYEELTLSGSYHHDPRSFRRAVDLLASGAAPFERLLGPPVDLAEVGEALRDGAKRRVTV